MSDTHHPVPAGSVRLEEDFPVSYAIYAMARVQRSIAAAKLATVGLFPGQEVMLMQLDASDGLSQKVLAETMRISHVTVAKMVARLERAGLVARRTSTQDRRITLVSLTDAGKAVREQIADVWSSLEAITNRDLDERGRRGFLDAVAEIRRSLDDAAVTSPADPVT